MDQTSAVFSSRLAEFYHQNHIAVGAFFRCANLPTCSVAVSDRGMKHGAEAHVGTKYGQPPRVVVVSLDAGGEAKTLGERCMDVERLTKKDDCNPHMRGTWRVLEALLALGDDVSPFPFCAITNSAKCTASDGKRDMASRVLFNNCRSLAIAELEILSPPNRGGPGRSGARRAQRCGRGPIALVGRSC
jgi:hypothetical protein